MKGELLTVCAALLILLGSLEAIYDPTFLNLPFNYLILFAALTTLATALWSWQRPTHHHSASALALVSGSLALVPILHAIFSETAFTLNTGSILRISGAILLLAQTYLPKPAHNGSTRTKVEEWLANRIHWQRAYVLGVVALAFSAWLLPLIASKPTNRLLQAGILGILDGSLYALIALGIIIINKATGVFNFGHGAMILVGGVLMFSFFANAPIAPLVALLYSSVFVLVIIGFSAKWRNIRLLPLAIFAILGLSALLTVGGADWWLLHSILGTLMGATILGLLVERFTIRPLIGQPTFAIVMATLALDVLLRGLVRAFWGTQSVTIPLFYFIPEPTIQLEIANGRIFLFTSSLLGMVVALLAYLAFILFFRHSRLGLAMRASAENQRLAQSLGLPIRILLAMTWGIAAVFAALAGTLLGASKGIAAELTPALALKAFPAVLLGGLESIPGALIGGLVIGIVEQYSILLFPSNGSSQLTPYLLLMIVLIIRPHGLFGLKRIERI